MPFAITITGPSRAGKSTTIRCLLACADEDFRPRLVPKYTTRPLRTDDKDDEVRCEPKIPDECDLIYEQYGVRYGLELHTIFEHIAEGYSPIVVLNDVRAVEDVRDSLGKLVRSLFVFRKDPSSPQYHQELVESRGLEDAEPRYERAQTIFRIYIENIQFFDHVIINSGSSPKELEMQVKQIVKGLKDPNWPLRERG